MRKSCFIMPCVVGMALAAVQDTYAQAEFVVRISQAELADFVFLEGPVWHPQEGLLFSDIPGDRTLKLEEDGSVSIYRSPTAEANGLILDLAGNLIAAESSGRRVVRYETSGSKINLADRYDGQRLNSPNDIAVDNEGRIYFTDPGYFGRETMERRSASGEIIDGVYRVDAPGEIEMILGDEISLPNGVALSPDNEYLYIAEYDGFTEGGARTLWRFGLDATGEIVAGTQTQLYEWDDNGGPDGMAVDINGNIYVAAGLTNPDGAGEGFRHGVVVFAPDGEILEFIPTHDEGPTANVTFGGESYDTLYITADDQIWRAPALAPGYVPGAR